MERLYGLTEMFPDSVRNGAGKTINFAKKSIKSKLTVLKTMIGAFLIFCSLRYQSNFCEFILWCRCVFMGSNRNMDLLFLVNNPRCSSTFRSGTIPDGGNV